MKTILHHIRTSLLSIATILVMSSAGSAEDFAKNYGLKFDAGIGFYVAIDGVPAPLRWTKDTADQVNDSDIMQIPFDAQFYSYGLDYSSASMFGVAGPQPPHFLGFGLSYMDMSGQQTDRWAARFVPVAGYEQKVYRIIFEGPYEDLRSDKLQYRFWAFETPGVKINNRSRPGYLFHFFTAKFAEEQKKLRAFISQALTNKDKAYKGNIITERGTVVTPFHIRFTSYDEKTGKVDAEVSGLSEKENIRFTGQLAGIRQLTLKQAGGDRVNVQGYEINGNTVWDFQISDQKKLIGEYLGASTFKIEIALEDTPTQ